jgi:hypothetical protein
MRFLDFVPSRGMRFAALIIQHGFCLPLPKISYYSADFLREFAIPMLTPTLPGKERAFMGGEK